MTEREKMLAGRMYDPQDRELLAMRHSCRMLTKRLNDSSDAEQELRTKILAELIPNAGVNLWVEPPFYCDYGCNITIGDSVFFNFNCVVLDVMEVSIGSRSMMGPNVQIYTATHPLNHIERSSGREYAKPISIGEDCWLGGGAIICPGVSIGSRSVIGAGSVVTKDIPADVFAAGNPCRVIRRID